jgi:uncharacterized protein (DUF697 family)
MEQEVTRSETAKPAQKADRTADHELNERAEELVKRLSMWSGAAGFIPIPLADIAVIGGIQVQMLRKLSELYGIPFSENRGKSLIAGLLGSVIPASSGVGIASVVKGVPVIGTTVGVFSMPALSAGATYLIGKTFMQHFNSGGTLLDFNPPDYREFIKAQTDKLKGKFDAAERAAPENGTAGDPAAAPSVDR